MNVRSTIVLASTLAFLVPAAASATGRIALVNPTGEMKIEVNGGDRDTIIGALPIASGRVEIQVGPVIGNRDLREFALTRLTLRMADLSISKSSGGDLSFKKVGINLRDSLVWQAPLDTPWPHFPGATPFYFMYVSPERERMLTFGDPSFQVAAMFTLGDRTLAMDLEQRASQPIIGKIDLDAKTIEIKIVLRGPGVDAPWYAPWVDDMESMFTITLSGSFTQVEPIREPKPGKVDLQPMSSNTPGAAPLGTPAF